MTSEIVILFAFLLHFISLCLYTIHETKITLCLVTSLLRSELETYWNHLNCALIFITYLSNYVFDLKRIYP